MSYTVETTSLSANVVVVVYSRNYNRDPRFSVDKTGRKWVCKLTGYNTSDVTSIPAIDAVLHRFLSANIYQGVLVRR